MNEVLKRIFQISEPSNRAQFFKITLCIALLQFSLSFIFIYFTEKSAVVQSVFWIPIMYSFVVILPLLYLYLVQYSKRLWDITADKQMGVVAGIIFFLISVICTLTFPIVTLAIYLTLILLPGKILNNE